MKLRHALEAKGYYLLAGHPGAQNTEVLQWLVYRHVTDSTRLSTNHSGDSLTHTAAQFACSP